MNKYRFNETRLGLINWIGFFALYKKEVLRFLVVWIQTLFSPLISALLFLLVLSLAIGKQVQSGEFAAYMKVTLINDGPVTIIIDSKNKE